MRSGPVGLAGPGRADQHHHRRVGDVLVGVLGVTGHAGQSASDAPPEVAGAAGSGQNPMASRNSSTVPRSGSYSALRMSIRLIALGYP